MIQIATGFWYKQFSGVNVASDAVVIFVLQKSSQILMYRRLIRSFTVCSTCVGRTVDWPVVGEWWEGAAANWSLGSVRGCVAKKLLSEDARPANSSGFIDQFLASKWRMLSNRSAKKERMNDGTRTQGTRYSNQGEWSVTLKLCQVLVIPLRTAGKSHAFAQRIQTVQPVRTAGAQSQAPWKKGKSWNQNKIYIKFLLHVNKCNKSELERRNYAS